MNADPLSTALQYITLQAEALSIPTAVRKVDTSSLAGQEGQDGASVRWRWRQAQAAEETFRNIAWACRDVSGKPNGTWIWDVQRTSRATSKASTTGLAVVQTRNMWAICWVGWVVQWQQAMRLKNLMLSLLLSAGSLEHLCLGRVFKEKNDQQWVSIYPGTASVIIWSTQVHGMRNEWMNGIRMHLKVLRELGDTLLRLLLIFCINANK